MGIWKAYLTPKKKKQILTKCAFLKLFERGTAFQSRGSTDRWVNLRTRHPTSRNASTAREMAAVSAAFTAASSAAAARLHRRGHELVDHDFDRHHR